jgi:hypothetical protein
MNNTNEIKYIPMYKSYIDAVALISSNEDKLAFYEAIFNYGFTGVEPTFNNPYLSMSWCLVKPNIDNNINNVLKNQENGKKGGRPIKNKVINEQPSIENTNNNANYSITDTQIEETYPSITEEKITQYDEDLTKIIKMTKSELKAKYDDYQKFSNGSQLDTQTFHTLTNDYFKNSEEIPLKKIYVALLSTGTFDGFYAEIIKLLELTETIKQN